MRQVVARVALGVLVVPELPEVETVKRGLVKLVIGKQILDVKTFNEKSLQASKSDIKNHLLNSKITSIRRRAKVLIIDLSSKYSLVIHLKMTGQIVVRAKQSWAAGHPTNSFVAELPDRSTRVKFDLSDHTKLFFNDQRKFGWIKLLLTAEVENIDFLKKVGPEPLSGDPKLFEHFLANIKHHKNTTIKSAILNQTVIAGIGNIYADESLFAASVHPATKVRDLSDAKLKKILESAIKVMQKSIESGGSTMKNYIKADGSKGDYLEKFAQVFRREGKPCPKCGREIVKIRVAGRGTHICPNCQKLKSDTKNF
jgi:formamidopyrimidine-DNA glycosylase